MYGNKRYIEEKYADMIMQLAAKYRNTHTADHPLSFAMDRALETMDSYVAFINNMGFTMYEISIKAMIEYIDEILVEDVSFDKELMLEIRAYLSALI